MHHAHTHELTARPPLSAHGSSQNPLRTVWKGFNDPRVKAKRDEVKRCADGKEIMQTLMALPLTERARGDSDWSSVFGAALKHGLPLCELSVMHPWNVCWQVCLRECAGKWCTAEAQAARTSVRWQVHVCSEGRPQCKTLNAKH